MALAAATDAIERIQRGEVPQRQLPHLIVKVRDLLCEVRSAMPQRARQLERALVEASRAAGKHKASARESLLGKGGLAAGPTEEDSIATLDRARAVLHNVLGRSEDTLSTLGSSSEALTAVQREYEKYGAGLTTTRNTLDKLQRMRRSDQAYLTLAMVYFVLVCLYIISVRFGLWALAGYY